MPSLSLLSLLSLSLSLRFLTDGVSERAALASGRQLACRQIGKDEDRGYGGGRGKRQEERGSSAGGGARGPRSTVLSSAINSAVVD